MRYEILDGKTVVNTINADLTFMLAQYPQGNYREVPDPVEVAATKRLQVMAQLAEIDADTDKSRTRREMLLNKVETMRWLQAKDDEAVALRAKLTVVNGVPVLA